MTTNDILRECFERQKASPEKSHEEILRSVMDDLDSYKAALRERPEFTGPESAVKS